METAKIEWAHNRQVYEMHKNVNAALISVFRQAIDPEVIADVETDPQIHQVTDFLTYFDQVIIRDCFRAVYLWSLTWMDGSGDEDEMDYLRLLCFCFLIVNCLFCCL
jgi:hypothetical protein